MKCLGRRRHGVSRTPEYRVWLGIKARCTNESHPAWADYGGRGITVCARWGSSVEAFVKDMSPKPSPEHQIDRADNDSGYWCGKCDECSALGRKANCRWVMPVVNDRNRRSNHMIEFRGERLAMAEWCERFGIRHDIVGRRLKRGWSVEEALTTPPRLKAPDGSSKGAV